MSRPGSGAAVDALRRTLAGASAARTRDDVERVLSAAGDLLRRSQSLPCPRAAIDAALVDLDASATLAWAERAPIDGLAPRLAAAVDAAVDMLTSDDDADRRKSERAALEALQVRDGLESCLVALARRHDLSTPSQDETHAARELVKRVAAVDKGVRGSARALVTLNGARRAERDRLDGDSQAVAWWYADRAECDDLAPVLAGRSGGPSSSSHLSSCGACARDISVARLVDEPVGPHPSSDMLWQLDAGELDPAQQRRIARHAERCPDCADALAAMRDADLALSQDA